MEMYKNEDVENNLKKLIGNKITYVNSNIDINKFCIEVEIQGTTSEFWFRVDGDCCSESWVEHYDACPGAIGSKVIGFHLSEMNGGVNEGINPYHMSKTDVLKIYELRLKTLGGDVVFEFRNDSNGYYGAYVSVCEKPEKSDVLP